MGWASMGWMDTHTQRHRCRIAVLLAELGWIVAAVFPRTFLQDFFWILDAYIEVWFRYGS